MTPPLSPAIEVPARALVLLVGASGSGKSTFAARHFPSDAMVSSDRLRGGLAGSEASQRQNEAVWARIGQWLDERLATGRLAVVDATNADWMDRAGLLDGARRHRRPAVAIVFALPVELCLARNSARGRRVRPGVVRRQAAAIGRDLDRLDLEGFATVSVFRSAADVDQARVRLT